jgi:hypothetical protein
VFSCDYNGWADVPEEEREGIDTFEHPRLPIPPAFPASPINEAVALVFSLSHLPAPPIIRRRAA